MGRKNYFHVAAALLVVALAVGGAGQNFPLLEMLLDLCALAAAAVLAWYGAPERLAPISRWALVLMACVLALPALQLVPLPPSIWQALPGRAVVAQVDGLLGLSVWRPLTLDVEGTVRALLNLIPASVLFFACLRLQTEERERLLIVIGAFALLNALLGIAQLASGGSMTPYPSSHLGYPLGLFVNRNHNAVFLLVAMPVLAALAARRTQASSSKATYVAGALALVTIVGVVVIATTSRMALALLPVALLGSLALLFFRQSIGRVAIPSLLVLGGVAAIISWVGGFNRNLSRFSSLHEGRFDYWDDVSWALHHYGLAGTGFGTFIPVYQTAESLSSVSPAVLNHAHNDFIEIALEGGIPALVLLAAFFVIVALAAVQVARKKFDFRRASLNLAAAVGVAIVLLFSLVDYPLRMPALSCVFAVLCACLLPTPVMQPAERELRSSTSGKARERRGHGRHFTVAGVFAAVVAAAILIVQAGVSQAQLMSDQFGYARAWAPWSTAAHEASADEAISSSRSSEAREEALHALRLSPIDAVALRTVAMTDATSGSARTSQQLMQIAVSLGWRDPFTQLWAIGASEQTQEPEKAVQRAQALFQQELFFPSALELLLRDAPEGPTGQALTRTLAANPEWRPGFMKAAAQLPEAYVAKLMPIVSRLNRSSAPVSPSEAQPLLQKLVDDGAIGDAQRLWMATHKDLVANGGFEQLSGRNGLDVPSDWDISDEDLATIAIQVPEFGGYGRAFRISGSARSGPILSQRLMLPPGSYSLSYRSRSGSRDGVRFRWTLRCTPSDTLAAAQEASANSAGWRQSASNFSVPIQDCPIQRLALERPDAIGSAEIWVDDVMVKRATH